MSTKLLRAIQILLKARNINPDKKQNGLLSIIIATRLSGFVDDSRVSPFTAIELSKVLVVTVLPLRHKSDLCQNAIDTQV